MNLKIMLRSQTDAEDNMLCDSFIKVSRKGKCIETESRSVVTCGWGVGVRIDSQWPWQKYMDCWKCSKIGWCWWLHNSTNLLKIIDLYTSSRQIVQYINHISIRLFLKKWYLFAEARRENFIIRVSLKKGCSEEEKYNNSFYRQENKNENCHRFRNIKVSISAQ